MVGCSYSKQVYRWMYTQHKSQSTVYIRAFIIDLNTSWCWRIIYETRVSHTVVLIVDLRHKMC